MAEHHAIARMKAAAAADVPGGYRGAAIPVSGVSLAANARLANGAMRQGWGGGSLSTSQARGTPVATQGGITVWCRGNARPD